MSPLDPNLQALYDQLDEPPAAEQVSRAITEELFTVQDVVRYCVSCFSAHHIFLGHGTADYWTEAIEIVQAVLHLQPPCDEGTLQARLTREERELIAKLICMRIFKRMPTPYLTHRAFFCGHEFYVDPRVLIPRSPIGELIDHGFGPYLKSDPERILDMCTGSGCIAIACALKFNNCQVDAVDISKDALAVAQINIEGYGLEDRVFPIESDLFEALPEGDQYDVIAANPPYVDEDDLAAMPDEFSYEPDLALGSGPDGLNCAVRILRTAGQFLKPDGFLILEVGNSAEHLLSRFPNVPFHFIDLKRGGTGVFMLTAGQLHAYQRYFN